MKLLVFLTLLRLAIFADDNRICNIDDRIMYSIASVERHKKTPIGYPYLISINKKKDQYKALQDTKINSYFLDSRTIDCENQEKCISILNRLTSLNIINIDCGCFQINYKFWSIKKKDYFDIKKSYDKACDIIMSHNKRNWTWENIAKYHSKTKKHNDRYKKNLLVAVKRNL